MRFWNRRFGMRRCRSVRLEDHPEHLGIDDYKAQGLVWNKGAPEPREMGGQGHRRCFGGDAHFKGVSVRAIQESATKKGGTWLCR